MKIAILAYACRGGGGLHQTFHLLSALKNVAQGEQFLFIFPAGYGYEKIDLPPGSQSYYCKNAHSVLYRLWFENVKLRNVIKNYRPDVIFGPGNTGLPGAPCSQAFYVRNGYLFYENKFFPEMHFGLKVRIDRLKRLTRKTLPTTNMILCQTPVVKKRFATAYNYPKKNIRVLGFPPPLEIKRVSQEKKPEIFLNNEFFNILVLTSYGAHKSPAVLLPLCSKHSDWFRSNRIRFFITITEEQHPNAKKFLNEVQNEFPDLIVNVGPLNRCQVAQYLTFSNVCWLPTLVECLSTTHLEAMAVGTPILSPNLDFAKYVCGEAAIYYDPWDIDTMYEGIRKLAEEPELCRKLVNKGQLQLTDQEKFPQDWNDVAKQLLLSLNEIVQ